MLILQLAVANAQMLINKMNENVGHPGLFGNLQNSPQCFEKCVPKPGPSLSGSEEVRAASHPSPAGPGFTPLSTGVGGLKAQGKGSQGRVSQITTNSSNACHAVWRSTPLLSTPSRKSTSHESCASGEQLAVPLPLSRHCKLSSQSPSLHPSLRTPLSIHACFRVAIIRPLRKRTKISATPTKGVKGG